MKTINTQEILVRALVIGLLMLSVFLWIQSSKPLSAIYMILAAILVSLVSIANHLSKLIPSRSVTNERPTHWLTERDYPQEARQEAAADRAAPGAGQG